MVWFREEDEDLKLDFFDFLWCGLSRMLVFVLDMGRGDTGMDSGTNPEPMEKSRVEMPFNRACVYQKLDSMLS